MAAMRCLILGALLSICVAADADAEDRNDEYRFTVDPSYALTADHEWVGVGHLGYIKSDDKNYQTDYLGVGAIWRFAKWGEVWLDAMYYRTDNEISADVDEWRPNLRFKNYFTQSKAFTFYNFARLEYQIKDREGPDNDTEAFRFRDRLGTVFALTTEQDRPGSMYGIADMEVFYPFDDHEIDRLRLRAGLGVTLTDRVRVELSCYAQFTKPDSDGFEWTDNIYRINIKLARHKGLLARLTRGEDDD